MTSEDFKKLLDESKEGIERSLKEIREEQRALREIVEKRVLPSLIYVETTVKSYADQYVANQDHIRRLDKRLHTA